MFRDLSGHVCAGGSDSATVEAEEAEVAHEYINLTTMEGDSSAIDPGVIPLWSIFRDTAPSKLSIPTEWSGRQRLNSPQCQKNSD